MKQHLVRMTKKAAHVIEKDLPEEIPSQEPHDGNCDSYGQKDQDKVANSKRRKRTRKKDVNTVNDDTSEAVENNHDDYRSPVLFCDVSIVKKK
ncbi:unnamed protein product, partial [Candidula unifasciata]